MVLLFGMLLYGLALTFAIGAWQGLATVAGLSTTRDNQRSASIIGRLQPIRPMSGFGTIPSKFERVGDDLV
jgi:hypothetical protein